ncbi:MCE family protein [[Mycobacterium] wendilense]|uniref:MCE family protein n=1 Tax=[Mycobacterium] wendilense TaxID=3064284 RepID=A0ABN9P2D9_9MYCO|nr:MCE family protein [Mycolicibacterium sp. MU0050]CAJ1585495.1 MCE family protein [Mycolicibacterium sp. MU0050]
MSHRNRAVVLAVAVLVFLGAGGWYVFGRTDNATVLHADFTYVNGIYPGSKVTVLGVPVGRVTGVTPQGTTVRVSMSLPADVQLPADVDAYIMSPALISDRSVELGPAYSGSGPQMTSDHVIPVERTHAPITFDSMLSSLTALTDALGPDQGDLGQLLARGADQWRGQGKQFNTAIRNLSSATGVVGARAEDIDTVVENLDTMLAAFNQRQVSLNDLVGSLGLLGDSWADQNLDITGAMNDLKTVLDQVNTVVHKHTDDMGTIAANLNAVGDVLTGRQPELAEFMDLLPLMMQNLSNTIGPDRRGRIRLNVSSALKQFADAHNFCERHQWEICSGIGIVNPLSFPISRSDPLGIVSAVTGVIPPPNPEHPR